MIIKIELARLKNIINLSNYLKAKANSRRNIGAADLHCGPRKKQKRRRMIIHDFWVIEKPKDGDRNTPLS